MQENEIVNKIYSYIFYALGVLSLICGVFLSNVYLIALTGILLLFSAVYFNSGHIVNNILIRRSNVIEIYNEYRLSTSLDSVVKKAGNEYRAVSIALLIIGKANNATHDVIEGLMEGIHEPFEFGILLREADRKRMIEALEVKRRMKEIVLSRLEPKHQDRINGLRREIDILSTEIQSIRKGGKALDVIVKLSSFGSAENEVEASREAANSIKHIADSFSAALGVEYELLKGEELLDFLEVSV